MGEHTTYKKNFLDQVVFRLDFEKTPIPKSFLESDWCKTFEHSKQIAGFEGSFSYDLSSGEFNHERHELPVWQFVSKRRTLTLGLNFAQLQYSSYKNSDDLIKDVSSMIEPMLQQTMPPVIGKLHLRYINKIYLKQIKTPTAWGGYIAKSLLHQISFTSDKGEVMRCMGRSEIIFDDDAVAMQYGIWNEDYPNPATKKEFILDIDVYNRYPMTVADLNLIPRVTRFSDIATDLFEASIDNKLRTILSASDE